MRTGFLFLALLLTQFLLAQKKPLDHTVYDSWQSIGEKLISSDGKWVVYTITPQEGDNQLVVQSVGERGYTRTIARGYNATITPDNRFVVFRIKAPFRDLREARVKKKRLDDFPKDSLGILMPERDSLWKMPGVRNYKTPAESYGWVAYHLEKPVEAAKAKTTSPDIKRVTDSLNRIIDSLKLTIQTMPVKKSRSRDESSDADEDGPPVTLAETGTTLVLRKLSTGEERSFDNVLEYYFSRNGYKLLIEVARGGKGASGNGLVLLYDLRKGFADTLSRGGNDFRNFTFSQDGTQVAYLAERDAHPKDLQKFYRLWYFREGMDSATMLIDRNSVGMQLGMTVSEYGNVNFSKSGRRLFFGTARIQPPKDTSLADIDLVKLDIWNYKDDYLQTVQLNRLQRDLRENFLAVYIFDSNTIRQLASKEIPVVLQSDDGDGERFVGITDVGRRIESQWTGETRKDLYDINVANGTKKLIRKDLLGTITASYLSPTGKYVLWYDEKARNYFVYDGKGIRNASARIKTPLYIEEFDEPGDPNPYGIMGWQEGDTAVYIYDRYDTWRVNVAGDKEPVSIFGNGHDNRSARTVVRYVVTDSLKRSFRNGDLAVVRIFDEAYKTSGYNLWRIGDSRRADSNWITLPVSVAGLIKAREAPVFLYTSESFRLPANLKYASIDTGSQFTWQNNLPNARQLSDMNPQQREYNWGTAELYRWKALNGKMAEGILYKPEDFDEKKKYPVIMYFYETLSNTLHTYMAPQPTASRLNIPFFVSRGYVVFVPDIHYTIGHPARSAYNYVVGAAKDLATHKWIDAKNIGIQGQSWGGIQVAQLITMTDMFKAAWAGAPVANMTSAYGGIRWESGANRQFQYERTQSRIGATLWEKPELYIENSPLFGLPAVKTPLVIMANDADGAVPWYQGIELFTAMRRLGKQVWMLNYNGEAHNLAERRNRKDIQIREQQYFDWLLKGARPPKWIVDGVPAVKKGRDWGLELVD